MPKIVILPRAREDLKRLVSFLQRKSGPAALVLRDRIDQKINSLALAPRLGSPFGEFHRVLVRLSRASVYEIVYFYDQAPDLVLIVSMRHSKEEPGHPAHGRRIPAGSEFDDQAAED